ncbi:MAG: hypothetical protein G8345_10935 [Magnetococcales bacterium]|nr:hypothetical protein [Magnetococcales bacterium]NGZ27387.1 hypothetical protein [Magnetococcales bacterium]
MTNADKIIKNKFGLLNLAEMLGSETMLARFGTLLFCALLVHTAQAAETVTRYEMTIAVEPIKIDDKPWDVAGGAPDIAIAVDGQCLFPGRRWFHVVWGKDHGRRLSENFAL